MNRARLETYLEDGSYAALIATSPEHIRYLTGYDPFQGVWNRFERGVVFAPGSRPVLVIPIAEVAMAVDQGVESACDIRVFGKNNLIIENQAQFDEASARVANLIEESSTPDPWSGMRGALESVGALAGPVIVDRTGWTSSVEAIGEVLRPTEVVDGGEHLLRAVRMVKTAAEVERLRAAAVVNEAAMDAVRAQLGSRDDRELAQIFAMAAVEMGGLPQHWIGGAGSYGGAYRTPGHSKASAGDRWRYDCGVVVSGYCADTGGTIQVGAEPSPGEREKFAAISAGIDAAVDQARPGVRTSDLYEAVLTAVRSNGLPNYQYSLAGHGIGIEPRDYPIIGPARPMMQPFFESPFDPVFEPGMVLNFEVPIVELGVGGYQHEVTAVVESDGPARLLSKRREYEVV
jgi:Xaa-Pro dipeptidase